MSAVRFRSLIFLLILSALALPSALAAQIDCGGAKAITRLGNPATRFSKPLTTVDSLQKLMSSNRQEVLDLLRQTGFQGDPQDFFRAVESGDGIQTTSVAPGTRLDWMFFREKGKPAIKRNVCWAGKAPFKAWEVQFTSKGTWYSVVVPEACGNLALLAKTEEPVCKVSLRDNAGDTCQQTELTVDATGSIGELVVELTGPDGQTSRLTSSNSSGSQRWTVKRPETKGMFKVVARSTVTTPRGTTLECRAESQVTRDCCVATAPTITLSAVPSTVEPFQSSTVTASPNVSECTTIDQVTIDGKPVTRPYQTTMTYDEPGTYKVPGTVRDALGQSAQASTTITVTECQTKECKKQRKAFLREQRRREREAKKNGGATTPSKSGSSKTSSPRSTSTKTSTKTASAGPSSAGEWVLRAWLSKLDTDGEFKRTTGEVREAFRLDNGEGAGAQLEYQFNRRIGLGFGLLLARPEVHYELDIAELWGMDEAAADTLTVFVGPTFHLTPDSRVDLFLSPFLGYTEIDDVTFRTSGFTERVDFDSEFSWGAQLGLDVPFGSEGRWGLHAGAIYQSLEMEAGNQGFSFDADPLSANLGLFFKF